MQGELNIKGTPVLARAFKALNTGRFNVMVFEGGSRSSKTYSLIQFFILYAINNRHRTNRVVIARKKGTWLASTVWNDFKEILLSHGLFNDCKINNSVKIIRLYTTTFEFIGLDDVQRLHGLTTDVFWINEAMEASKDDFDQLEQRCTRFSILDYNPSAEEHWIYDNVCKREDCYFDHSTMLDNPFIPENMKRKILSYEPNEYNYAHGTADKRKWLIYGLGKRAKIEGLIFENYTIIKEVPIWVKRRWQGLDFGYSCFVGDTLIETANGSVPIRNINRGDMVLTRYGYRKVLNVFNNGYKKVVEKEIDVNSEKKRITATYNHNFNVNNKWKKYGDLTKGDNLYILSHSTEKNTKDTLRGNIQTTITLNGRNQGNISQSYCIMQFINTIKERFQKVRLYIMSIVILLITQLIIYLQSLFLNMQKYMQSFQYSIRLMAKKIVKKTVIEKIIGILGDKKCLMNYRKKQEPVRTAMHHLLRPTLIRDFVQKNAIIVGNIMQKNSMLNLSAKAVVKSLWGINISNQKHAVLNAQINYQSITEIKTVSKDQMREVYDIEVEDVHEYFANGILVHNCDPSACSEVGFLDNGIYIDEEFYKTNMLSTDIINDLKLFPRRKIWSESADPRLLKEIYNAGFNIHPVKKFQGSVKAGIDFMQGKKLFITENSVNAKKELDNYTWQQDKNGKWLNEPEDNFNHCFTGDTLIKTKDGQKRIDEIEINDIVLTSKGYKPVNKVFDNGYKKVLHVKLIFDTFVIDVKATSNHKFKTKNGWKKLEQLTKGDILFTLSSSTENATRIVTNKRGTEVSVTDTPSLEKIYGNSIMESLLRDMSAAIRMVILQMSILAILKWFPLRNHAQDSLTKGKILNHRHSMEKTFIDIPKSTISQKVASKCINMSGLTTMGIFQRDTKYITKTLMPLIIPLTTLFAFHLKSINKFIEKGLKKLEQVKRCVKTWMQSETKQKLGTQAKKAGYGIQNMGKGLLSQEKKKNSSAKFVENIISQSNTQLSFAQMYANQNTEEWLGLTMKNEYASGAAKHSSQTNTVEQDFVEENVLEEILVINDSIENVYDIEVDEAHEYFANGVLVHNCIDGVRYVCLMELMGRKEIINDYKGVFR